MSGSADNTVRIWDLEKRNQVSLVRHTSSVLIVIISSDNKYIASGSHCLVILWNLQEKCNETVLEDHKNCRNCVAISSSSKYLFSCVDNSVKIWNIQERREENGLNFKIGRVNVLVVSKMINI